ncbi:hypothetical protein B5X24_HaOG203076 [Helicoverpa armigera]|uniref:Uncharacterized protein n=1 Tax=Helicoverpa armigera TaxID=29058 RepID=A0A2W1BRK3_HELAM|nr:hypothetical protein B5X24_HaOG203076 [Helicoverpa armigera]
MKFHHSNSSKPFQFSQQPMSENVQFDPASRNYYVPDIAVFGRYVRIAAQIKLGTSGLDPASLLFSDDIFVKVVGRVGKCVLVTSFEL